MKPRFHFGCLRIAFVSQADLEKRKATFVYIMRATAWARVTAVKERFGLALPRLGLADPRRVPWSGPEATVPS